MKTLVPVVLLCAGLAGSACAQARVATVDLSKVFGKYWKTEQATITLRERAAEMEKSRNEMVDSYRKAKQEYQKLLEDANNQAVAAEERDKRKKAAEDKLRELKSMEDDITQFERRNSATLSEQKARIRKNLLEEIRTAINSKAKSGGYSVVIDSSAQTYVPDPSGPYVTPTLLYADDQGDLTEAVISQLNAGAPLEIPKPEEKPAEPKGKK